jgi:FtsH-binding integral membrane protein
MAMQYAGLALYVVSQAIIFIPLLYVAAFYSSPEVIPMAAMITMGLFLGLTGIVVTTRIDFSFLRGVLVMGTFVALAFIVASILFGFNLGTFFAGVMVAFAAAAFFTAPRRYFETIGRINM